MSSIFSPADVPSWQIYEEIQGKKIYSTFFAFGKVAHLKSSDANTHFFPEYAPPVEEKNI